MTDLQKELMAKTLAGLKPPAHRMPAELTAAFHNLEQVAGKIFADYPAEQRNAVRDAIANAGSVAYEALEP